MKKLDWVIIVLINFILYGIAFNISLQDDSIIADVVSAQTNLLTEHGKVILNNSENIKRLAEIVKELK